ncbi:unnamed protein product [Phytophthora lilii]|uniref:Unnamed protein product n=1 Tax=Phytophthora lilii TaxID=2077276 RepID=A0A9W7CQ19_9STRA|nr:unnamed protein product [Phytophthora lilii]
MKLWAIQSHFQISDDDATTNGFPSQCTFDGASFFQTLKTIKDQAQNSKIPAPLFAMIAIARFAYQHRQAQLELQCQEQDRLTGDSETEEGGVKMMKAFALPVTEWNTVAGDGTQALSLVYYPTEEDEVGRGSGECSSRDLRS